MLDKKCPHCNHPYGLLDGIETYIGAVNSVSLYPILYCYSCKNFFVPNKYGDMKRTIRKNGIAYINVHFDNYTDVMVEFAETMITRTDTPRNQRVFLERIF